MATEFNKLVRAKNLYKQDLFTGDPIEITNSYQDFSDVINSKGAKSVVLWVNIDVGTSTDIDIKALAGYDRDSVDYQFAIETVSASQVSVEPEVVRVPDSDNKFALEFILSDAVPYIKFQVKDSADGDGQLDSAVVTFKK